MPNTTLNEGERVISWISPETFYDPVRDVYAASIP